MINYDLEMEKELKGASGKRLLLHCCCAPCSSACLERLFGRVEITALFYNPNIEREEYFKRKDELIKFIARTGYAKIMDCDEDFDRFYAAAAGLEGEKEGGARCAECFKLRLSECERRASEGGYDFFATTLTLSPLKNAELINKTGESLQREGGAKWLHSDFKKRGGYLRSIALSKQYGLYRQNFCGCVFSKRG